MGNSYCFFRPRKGSIAVLTPASTKLNSFGELNQSNATDSGREDDVSIPFPVLQLLNLSQEIAMIIIEAVQGFSKFFAVSVVHLVD